MNCISSKVCLTILMKNNIKDEERKNAVNLKSADRFEDYKNYVHDCYFEKVDFMD